MGHVRKKGKYYQIVAETTRDPASGKRRQIWETVRGSREDALQRLRDLESSLHQGDFIERNRITLGEWLKVWCDSYVVNNLKKRTADSYKKELNGHIVPALGSILLQKLTSQQVEDYKNHALAAGRTDATGGLSPATTRYHLNIKRYC